jgi:hypothetical protein
MWTYSDYRQMQFLALPVLLRGGYSLYRTNHFPAKSHGKSGSDNGHWIYPGEVLVIP